MKLHLLSIGKYILVGKQLHNKLTNSTIISFTHMKKYMIELLKFSGNYWHIPFQIFAYENRDLHFKNITVMT